MEFVHPNMFWFLLAVPPLLFILHLRRRKALLFPPRQFMKPKPGDWQPFRTALEFLLLIFLIITLARPYTESQFEKMEDEGIDIVLVLDVSLSMLAEDFPPNRLAVLQEIARDFLARSGGHRVGLVIFAGDTYVQSPPTNDRVALSTLLESVSVYALNQSEGGGTAVGDALLVATQGLERLKTEGRDQAIVLITDGESNLGIDPMLAVRHMREKKVRLYAIGVGSETPQKVMFEGKTVGGDETPFLASLDDRALKAMTEVAKGSYYRATNSAALMEIFGELSRLESAPLKRRAVVERHESTHWFAVTTFLFFGLLSFLELVLQGRPWR